MSCEYTIFNIREKRISFESCIVHTDNDFDIAVEDAVDDDGNFVVVDLDDDKVNVLENLLVASRRYLISFCSRRGVLHYSLKL